MTTYQLDTLSFKYQEQRYQITSDAINSSLSFRVWPANEVVHTTLEASFESSFVTGFKRINCTALGTTEYQVESTLSREDLITLIKNQVIDNRCHYAFVPTGPSDSNDNNSLPKLVMFDMDSTLIQMECIDELARQCGLYDKVSSITEAAMRGELDFSQSLRARVQLLSGLPEQVLRDLAAHLPVTNGVRETVDWCQQKGIKIAVVSGGFTLFVEQLKRDLNLDYAIANLLEIKNNELTGEVIGDIVDGEYKRTQLIKLSNQLNLESSEVWAVGDGANDIPMLNAAGLGIAFDAKPKVREFATAAILSNDMSELLTLLKSQSAY